MSYWEDEPEEKGAVQNFQIVRTPPSGTIDGIILSRNIVGAKLHYWRGRSTPCEKELCQPCRDGQQSRWKGYVLIAHPRTRKIVIFEFTDRAWPSFKAMHDRHGSLRGCIMRSRRMSSRPNGPLLVTFEEARHDESLIPSECDLRQILAHIWERHDAQQILNIENRLDSFVEEAEPKLNGRAKSKR